MVAHRRIGPDGGFLREFTDVRKRVQSLETRPSGVIATREMFIVTDPETGVKTIMGKLPDGSTGFQPFVGDIVPPPVATAPTATAQPGTITVTWDGTFVGGAEQPADFEHLNVMAHKVVTGSTVLTLEAGSIRLANESVVITSDIISYGETWQFSFESEDYNGNISVRSARTPLIDVVSYVDDSLVGEALSDLAAATQTAQEAADNAQGAAVAAQDDADAAAASALAASNLAGSKGKVYTQSAAPSADYSGLWIDTAHNNVPRRYLGVRNALFISGGGGASVVTRLSAKGWAVSSIASVPAFEEAVKYDLVAMDAGYAGLGTSHANLATKLYDRGVSLYTSGNDTISMPPLFTGAPNRGTPKNVIKATSNALGISYADYADTDLNLYLTGVNSAAVVTGTTFVTSLGTDQPLNLALEHPTNFSRWVHIETYNSPAAVIDNHLDWISNNWVAIQDQGVISASSAAASAQIRADQAFNNAASAATAAGDAQISADGKNAIWYRDDAPAGTGHKLGDTWFDTNDNYKVRTWNGTIWQTTQDSWLAQQTAESKGRVYTQDVVPPVEARLPQNIWNDTSLGLDKVVVKYWSTTTNNWEPLADKAATEARVVADSKGETIYSNTEPAAAKRLPQNLWIDTTGGININKRWDGNAWVVVADTRIASSATAVTAADAKAQTALDTAVSKGTVYTQNVAPPVEARLPQNLWVDTSLGLNNTVTKYWDPTAASGAGAWVALADKAATDAATLAGSKSKVIYNTTAPTGADANALTLWINTTGGANTPMKWVSGTTWTPVTDKVATDAATAAATKGTVIYSSSTPAVSAQLPQNLWIDTTGGININKRWDGSGWIVVADTRIASSATAVTAADSKAQSALDSAAAKSVVYTQNTTPPVEARLPQTLWNDTSLGLDKIVVKFWDQTAAAGAGAWVSLADKAATDAAALAATKTKTYFQNNSPGLTGNTTGDLWFDTDDGNKAYVWNGTWAVAQDAAINKSIFGTFSTDIDQTQPNKWLYTRYDKTGLVNNVAPSYLDIVGLAGASSLVADGTNLVVNVGEQYIGQLRTVVNVVSSKTIAVTATHDDGAQIYVDGVSVYSKSTYTAGATISFSIPAGWHVIDLLWLEQAGGDGWSNISPTFGSQFTSMFAPVSLSATSVAVSAAQATANSKGEVIYSDNPPAASKQLPQNLWVDTTGGINLHKRWNGAWQVVADGRISTTAAQVSALSSQVASVSAQADRSITTFYGTGTPASPESGDLWLAGTAGVPMKRWSGAAWDTFEDPNVQAAYTKAGDAQAAADAKVRTFAQDTEPDNMVPNDVGDIWIDTNDNNKMWRYSGAAWVAFQDGDIALAQEKADTAYFTASSAVTAAQGAQTTADGKNTIYYEPDQPSGGTYKIGDLWFDTNDNYKLRTFAGGTTWTVTQDSAGALTAATAASNSASAAMTAANGKNKVIHSTSAATGTTGYTAGDTWFQRDASGYIIAMWEFTTSWQTRAIGNDVIAANINAGKVTAGTLSADRIGANTIGASKLIVGDMEEIIPNPFFHPSGEPVQAAAGTIITTASSEVSAGAPFPYALKIQARDNHPFATPNIAVRPGDQFYMEAWVRAAPTTTRAFNFYIFGSNQPVGGLSAKFNSGQAVTTTWTKKTYAFTVPLNANYTYIRPVLQVETVGGDTADKWMWYVTGWSMRRKNGGELIVDGAIKAGSAIIENAAIDSAKISSVNAGTITVGQLEGWQIKANAIDASKLNVSLGGSNLVANSSFEADTDGNGLADGWNVWARGAGDAGRVFTCTRPAGHFPGSTFAQRVTSTTVTNTESSSIQATTLFSISASTSAAFSLYGRASVAGSYAVSIRCENDAGGYMGDASFTAAFTTTAQRFSGVVITPAGTTKGKVTITSPTSLTNGHWFEVDGIQVQLGNVGSSWGPMTEELLPGTIKAGMLAADSVIANNISASALNGKIITGSTVQTEATASRGIKLTSTELAGYDGAGNKNFSLTSAGALTVKGNIKSGSTIEGATITGSDGLQTSGTANTGVKMTNAGIKAYDSGNNLSFHLDATTGYLEVPGLKANSVKGDTIIGKSIATDKLLIGSTDNLVSEPDFRGGGLAWGLSAGYTIDATGGRGGSPALKIVNAASQQGKYNLPLEVPINEEASYHVSAWIKSDVAIPVNGVALYFRTKNAAGANATPAVVESPAIPANTWTKISGIYKVPVGALTASFGVFSQSFFSTGNLWIDFVSVTRAADGSLVVDGAIDGKLITAPTIQTHAGATSGIKLTPTELMGFDGANKNFSLTSDGALTLKGAIQSGSTIEGAKITGTSGLETSTIANTGVKVTNSGIKAYDSGNNLSFYLDATTGKLEVPGLKANSVKGDVIEAGSLLADKVVVQSGTNLIPDPGFVSDAMTALRNTNSTVTVVKNATTGDLDLTTPGTGNYYFRPTGFAQTASAYQNWIPVTPGDQFYYSATVTLGVGALGDLRMTGRAKDGQTTIGGFPSVSDVTSGVPTEYNVTIPTDCYWVLPEIRLYNGAATSSIQQNSLMLRQKAIGKLIVDGAIDGKVITGPTIQTEATASRGIKLTSAELAGYDGSGNKNFSLSSAGALTLKGEIKSGSTIEGARITGTSGLETSTVANTGVKITNTGIKAYDSGNNLSFHLDSTTGKLEVPGLKANSIKGDMVDADAITARNLYIGDLTNLILSATNASVSAGWTTSNGTLAPAISALGALGFTLTKTTGGTEVHAYSPLVDVVPGEKMLLTYTTEGNWDSGNAAFYGSGRDKNGAVVTFNPGTTGANVAGDKSYVFAVPANVYKLSMRAYLSATTTGGKYATFSNVSMRRQTTGTLIADNAVTTGHMQAGTIDAAVLSAGSIKSPMIEAKSIGVDKLVVSSTDNLIVESSFENTNTPGASWTRGTNQIMQIGGGRNGGNAIRLTGMNGGLNYTYNLNNKIQVNDTHRYKVAMWVKTNVAYAVDKIRVGVSPYAGTTKNTNFSFFSNTSSAATAAYVPGTNVWTRIEGMSKPLPAGTTAVEFYINATAPSATAYVDIDSIEITRASDGLMIVDGSITADKLEADLILATKIVAGDPNGTHAEMTPNGFKVYAKNLAPSGGPPTEAVRLGVEDTDDYFAITKADGKYAASISQEGIGSFTSIYALKATTIGATSTTTSGGFYYGGKEFTNILDERPRGIIAAAYRDTSSAYNATIGGPFQPYLRLEAKLEPGRMYKVWTSAMRVNTDTGVGCTVSLSYNPDTYATVDNSNHFTQAFAQPNSNGGRDSLVIQELFAIGGTVPKTYSFLMSFAIQEAAAGATGQAGMRGTPAHPIRMVVEDIGPNTSNIGSGVSLDGTLPPPPPKNNYVKQYGCTNSMNYQTSGAQYPFDTGRMYQGLSPAGYGNLGSIALFDRAAIQADLSGATVNYVRVYFNFQHWYYNSGGTARIGVHSHTGIPGTWSSLGPLSAISGGWPKPGARWVDLSSSHWEGFKNGYGGVYLEGDTSYNTYGYSDRPTLEIGYNK